ncbi:hypothetical protein [Chitinophaga pinensis]|uniref:Uncharacterized protein n=1 Tax=Chitinophaga pinensis TaxID=79329 RepID=A0A5C6LKX0_9BACT|nr:hypothetical protein [Chitinophaga pinensis]TWV91263.1 hypothetical protein FEF09_28875 [Chitinophaga pinensis]
MLSPTQSVAGKKNGYLLQESDSVLLQHIFMTVPALTVCATERAWHHAAVGAQQHSSGYYYVHVAHVEGVSTFLLIISLLFC